MRYARSFGEDELRAAGPLDEGSADVQRTGEPRQDPHRLKRAMATLVQQVALAGKSRAQVDGTCDNPIDLTNLCKGITEQGDAMVRLAEWIAENNAPQLAEQIRLAVDAVDDVLRNMPADKRLRILPKWGEVRHELKALPAGRSDHERALERMPAAERVRLTEQLQWQQFVAAAMGLRAEWLRDAGLAAWVRLSAITEALSGTKFMARKKGGKVVFAEARTITLEAEPRALAERFDYARRFATEGLRVVELEALYELGRVS